MPLETFAYAINRFDRIDDGSLIHTEDFAQVLGLHPAEKYDKANYEMIGRSLLLHSKSGIKDLQQMARRLLVNILLANADAHAKNWTLIYRDQIYPELSPAYDIVSTLPYIPQDTQSALNMGKTKDWYQTNMGTFEYWALRIGAPWSAIKPHLNAVMETARSEWPSALDDLPVVDEHSKIIKDHWRKLHSDFRID